MKFTHCSIPYRSHDVTFAKLVSQGGVLALNHVMVTRLVTLKALTRQYSIAVRWVR